MNKDKHKEWFLQAKYDLATARVMHKSGRYIYAVFFCHLAVEKALKGIFTKKFGKNPPKTHNLLYFVNAIKLKTKKEHLSLIMKLNESSIPTRYPEDLKSMLKELNKNSTGEILKTTAKVLKWLKIE